MKKIMLLILSMAVTLPLQAADIWTDYKTVGDIYTFVEEDHLYVYLDGVSCPKAKSYFIIHPSRTNNAKQMIAMILAAKMSKAQINLFYDPDDDPTFCFVKGVRIRN